MSNFPGPSDTLLVADLDAHKFWCQLEEQKIPLVQLVMLTIFVVVGLVGNGSVAFVSATLKEYAGSRQGWLLKQMTIANIVHLIAILFTIASEAIGKWTMGQTSCKLKNFIYESSFYVSVVYLIATNIERTITFTGSHLPRGIMLCCSIKGQRVISAILVWTLALCGGFYQFQHSAVSVCYQCALEHPISHQELCQLFKNTTNCNETWIENKNMTTIIYIEEEDYYLDYGNESTVFYDYLKNMSMTLPEELLYLDMCRHDEMKLFYVELYSKFCLLFVFPILVMFASTSLSVCKKPTTISGQISTTLHHWMMTVHILNILFVVSWLPWQAVSLSRVKGMNLDNGTCHSIVHYSKFSKVFYPVLFPFIYIIFTKNFRHQLIKSLASIAYCMVEHSPITNTSLVMNQSVGRRISQDTQCCDSDAEDNDNAA